MTKIKICGFTKIEDALFAAQQGIDFIGLVFAPSHRRITPDYGLQIADTIRTLKECPDIVGVFVNESVKEINRIALAIRLDYVQLSGDETWETCLQIDHPVIKAIHITAGKTVRQVLDEIETGIRFMGSRKWLCLIDSKVGTAYGGTGHAFDWRIAEQVSVHFPVIIAGGLDAANIGALVRQVNPWGVDVASGVETDGKKDRAKIAAFTQAVRYAAGPVVQTAAADQNTIMKGDTLCH